MEMGRRQFAVTLALTPGIGGQYLVRILARNDLLGRSPAEFFALSPECLQEEYRLPRRVAAVLAGRSGEEAMEMERRMARLGISLITAADAHYPQRLEAFDPDPPGLLFVYGNARLLERETFAVLSSRRTSIAGLDLIESWAEEGVFAGEVLVSGHDTPEYQRASVVPLRWGAPRVLVLDRGMFEALGPELKSEPFRAARLWRYEFDPKSDLVISPFRPNARFIGAHNQTRDKVIASLADRLQFVEVAPSGNMERLLRQGLRAGRTVTVSDRSLNYRFYAREGANVA